MQNNEEGGRSPQILARASPRRADVEVQAAWVWVLVLLGGTQGFERKRIFRALIFPMRFLEVIKNPGMN